jgi:hypothetical protein
MGFRKLHAEMPDNVETIPKRTRAWMMRFGLHGMGTSVVEKRVPFNSTELPRTEMCADYVSPAKVGSRGFSRNDSK